MSNEILKPESKNSTYQPYLSDIEYMSLIYYEEKIHEKRNTPSV